MLRELLAAATRPLPTICCLDEPRDAPASTSGSRSWRRAALTIVRPITRACAFLEHRPAPNQRTEPRIFRGLTATTSAASGRRSLSLGDEQDDDISLPETDGRWQRCHLPSHLVSPIAAGLRVVEDRTARRRHVQIWRHWCGGPLTRDMQRLSEQSDQTSISTMTTRGG